MGSLRPSTGVLLSALDPLHSLVGEPVERENRQFDMFLFRILNLVVADPLKRLHEHHHDWNAGARHFRRVMQGTRRKPMRDNSQVIKKVWSLVGTKHGHRIHPRGPIHWQQTGGGDSENKSR